MGPDFEHEPQNSENDNRLRLEREAFRLIHERQRLTIVQLRDEIYLKDKEIQKLRQELIDTKNK